MSRAPILFLPHRIPYPPNKGDKLRSFNLLRKLAESHRVFLGTFVDSPDDRNSAKKLSQWCEEVYAPGIQPAMTKLRSLGGLVRGESLSITYYRHRGMHRWVERIAQANNIRTAVAFSGPMAQYLAIPDLGRRVIDFCDVDSAKWKSYADNMKGVMAWLYRREAEYLSRFERDAARRADASLVTTDAEARILLSIAPEIGGRVRVVKNGVDFEYFHPELAGTSPYPANSGPNIVFTGVMDYHPNIDAVNWFVQEMMPLLRLRYSDLNFYIVGMNPSPAVRALSRQPGVYVTGKVDDVRPWVGHASIAVAPLRIARGVQNKILEAMAMAVPVVTTSYAASGLGETAEKTVLTANDPVSFCDALSSLLDDSGKRDRMSRAGRNHVLEHYSWQANLAILDELCAA